MCAETERARTVFVGDGINDAPAMQAATVGIAFGYENDITREAADAVILDRSLGKVDELIHIGARTGKTALQSAVGYGVECGRHGAGRVWLAPAGQRRGGTRAHRSGGGAQRPSRDASLRSAT